MIGGQNFPVGGDRAGRRHLSSLGSRYPIGVVLLMMALLAGCNRDGRYPVSGTVTWKGEPIPKGHITFVDISNKVAPDAGEILDGAFQFRAAPGTKRVEIFADRPVGKVDAVMKVQARQQYIPVRYNEESDLTAEILAAANTLKFELDEQPGDQAAGADVARSPE